MLQSVLVKANAQWLRLCSSALFGPCCCLAGGQDWDVLCFPGSEEARLKEDLLESGLGHMLQEALTALLAGGKEKVYREEREGKHFNHSSKKQQGVLGMGYYPL